MTAGQCVSIWVLLCLQPSTYRCDSPSDILRENNSQISILNNDIIKFIISSSSCLMIKAKVRFRRDCFVVSDGYRIEKKNTYKLLKIDVTCSILFLSTSVFEIYLIWR